jgi:hypothetical protein
VAENVLDRQFEPDEPNASWVRRASRSPAAGGRHDLLPGLIFGLLKHDALTASEAAIGVLLDAVRGNLSPRLPAGSGDPTSTLAKFHERFHEAAELERSLPGGLETTVKLLRFSDSFSFPPATEWTELELGGEVESLWRLALRCIPLSRP